jgi:hypothetical protein
MRVLNLNLPELFSHNPGESQDTVPDARRSVLRSLPLETGIDFTRLFTADNPSPGYLRPFAGAGWQF